MNNWICRAVELAADAGFVTRANTTFRPQDKVTRAEAFSMIYKASGNTLDIPEKMTVGNVAIDKDIAYWQQELFFKITSIDRINIPGIKFVREVQEDSPANGSHEYYFYPNRAATRAEIFSFAKNILEYKPLCSLDSPNFTCGNITMGAEPGPNYNPPEVCGCKPISCPAGQSVIISPDVGYWPDGSAKGIFTCSSEYPA